MTTPITTSTTDSQMHNNIMAAGSRDRPPMLATGRYAQWRSRFLRYIDTKTNGDALRKCILEGPYIPSTVVIQVVPATENSPAVPEHTTVETILNMSPANKAHFESEKEAIHMILTGIGDEIYSTVDACNTAHEMWEAIERLQQASEEDSDPEQAQKDKDMQKNLALIAKYFKKLYKPTNNNLRTSSNTRNKNVDTNPRYKTDNQTGQFGNQRAENVVGARETVGGPVVQQSGIQCFNCKELGHYAKECRKPKRVRDSTYHKEKMLLCKQAEKGVQLQAEQYDWLADTDEEIDEQELEAHYSYMAKIQEVPNADSGTDAEPLEQVHYDTDHNVFANDLQHFEQSESIRNTCAVETGDSNVIPDSPDMCDNDIQNDQHDVECDDERVALANLIANLKLDVDDNKKIQKQLKKANATLTQELTECKSILAETSRTLGESNSIRDSCLVALQNKQTEFERYKAFNDRTVDYDKLERKLNETLGLLAQKDIDIQEGLKVKAYEISVVQAKHDELVKQSLLTRSHYEGLVKEKTKAMQAVRNTNVIKPGMYRIASSTTQTRAPQLNQTFRNTNPCASTSTGVAHKTNVSRPQPRSNQMKDKVVQYTSHAIALATEAGNGGIGTTCPSSSTWVPKTQKNGFLELQKKGVLRHKSNGSLRLYNSSIFMVTLDAPSKHDGQGISAVQFLLTNSLVPLCFGNDHLPPILGYGDLFQGNITIKMVYYVEEIFRERLRTGIVDLISLHFSSRHKTSSTPYVLWHKAISNSKAMVMASKAFSSQLRLHKPAFKIRNCDWFTDTKENKAVVESIILRFDDSKDVYASVPTVQASLSDNDSDITVQTRKFYGPLQ
ncbi:integrase, catalytic region, zinc finger, CCHC-type containing protein [Tanacetum coccineum]|uniref:Integrase, catalytic region, zinc finger, CCHC-type containing protein n=2 Tax=Tanacetum coccineum TaxID=301880 RepID=A0ABQ5AWC1_9ASTR